MNSSPSTTPKIANIDFGLRAGHVLGHSMYSYNYLIIKINIITENTF